ncbi:MAG: hypothetical protein ACYDC8_07420 [Gammaproteobacteria bacterium]
MKLNKAIFVTSALVLAGSVQASTVFGPSDQNVNVFTIIGSPAGLQLGMFDDSDTAFSGSFLNVDITNGDVLAFSPTIGSNTNYTVTNNMSNTLTLTGNDLFSLALRQSAGVWMNPDSVVCSGHTNSCSVSWNGFLTNLVVDVAKVVPPASVPVPAALWLFGSGLVGLVGVSRRGTATV